MADETDVLPHRGLEELRWQSLTGPEKLVVSRFLESSSAPPHAHLDHVAIELRQAASSLYPVPLVLTPLQNRTISSVLVSEAQALENASEKFADQPAVARTGHYAAGYLRSLVDRLVKAASADPETGRERVVQLLLVEGVEAGAPQAVATRLAQAAAVRLQVLGFPGRFGPVLDAYAEEASRRSSIQMPPKASSSVDDAAFDFEIVDVTEAEMEIARRTFEAALQILWIEETGWNDFVASLGSGRVRGCEGAVDYPAAAEGAATTAYSLVTEVRKHLHELAGLPWEAVSPGLKSILDRYPALKQQASVKDFVREEVRRQSMGGERLT